jgi:sugar transferase EpsL
VKRLLDLGLTIACAPLWIPAIAVLAILVRIRLGKDVFFTQLRPGLGGRPFRMIKLRTMTTETDANGTLLPDAQRLTPFGRWLRQTSLDELPELWNVLRGEMSLVGPRPLLMEYVPLYSASQARRHEVKPGITGWAQVNGRNAVSWEEKFRMDIWYVDNRTLLLDLRILMTTVTRVFNRDGITPAGQDLMPRFEGTGSRDDRG